MSSIRPLETAQRDMKSEKSLSALCPAALHQAGLDRPQHRLSQGSVDWLEPQSHPPSAHAMWPSDAERYTPPESDQLAARFLANAPYGPFELVPSTHAWMPLPGARIAPGRLRSTNPQALGRSFTPAARRSTTTAIRSDRTSGRRFVPSIQRR